MLRRSLFPSCALLLYSGAFIWRCTFTSYAYNAGESTAIARNTREETYEQIISDCQNAIDMLPTKAEYDSDNVRHASKEAAICMMADIKLTLASENQSYYQDVADLCDEIAALGYDLANYDFEDNFDAEINNDPESLFEVQYSGSTEYDFWATTRKPLGCPLSWNRAIQIL